VLDVKHRVKVVVIAGVPTSCSAVEDSHRAGGESVPLWLNAGGKILTGTQRHLL
jgi:hypothetical protein